jgi:hypothetical protein
VGQKAHRQAQAQDLTCGPRRRVTLRFDAAETETACLSYLEAGGLTNARYLIRRLRRKRPAMRIILGLWTLSDEAVASRNALRETGADVIAISLAQAIAAVRDAVAHDTRPVREVGSM